VSEAPQPGAPTPQAQKFTEAKLEKLLAPIALYPDALLAQLLSASAYPLEIVQGQRWLDKNKAAIAKQDFSGGDAQDGKLSVIEIDAHLDAAIGSACERLHDGPVG
jgi:hypothetical protein